MGADSQQLESGLLLVSTAGPLQGKRYVVGAKGLTLGRDSACDVVIPDENVSRRHARIVMHNGAAWVQDEGSRNGVFVNAHRVVRHRQLNPGGQIAIGEHCFVLEQIGPGTEETVEVPPMGQVGQGSGMTSGLRSWIRGYGRVGLVLFASGLMASSLLFLSVVLFAMTRWFGG